MTVNIGNPADNSIEAAPWRRSCSRTLRSPAAAASSPNRRVTYSGRSGSPFSRVNTSPVTRTRRHSPSGAADRAARPRATLDINALNSPPARAAQTRHARLSSSCPVRVRPFLLRPQVGLAGHPAGPAPQPSVDSLWSAKKPRHAATQPSERSRTSSWPVSLVARSVHEIRARLPVGLHARLLIRTCNPRWRVWCLSVFEKPSATLR